MKMRTGKKAVYTAIWGLLSLLIVSCTLSPKDAEREKIDGIIEKMSLEDKASLVVGTGMNIPGSDGASSVALTDRLVPGAAGTTSDLSHLGITPMVLADGPAGLRISPTRPNDDQTYYCTAFPIATLLASSWDTDLVYKVGQAMGREVLEYGADILLAPALNLHRNPLCGRNFEYYSEDPLVTGKITAAMVKGVQSQNVGTSIKHYAANNQETNRFTIDTIVSERALRELYLEGFRIAVDEAQPWTVMSAYNQVNGVYASHSHDLLTKILRDDWGFQGFVMTDWLAGNDAVVQMKAGNDLLMPGNPAQKENIIAAVQNGQLEESVLDRNVARILNIMLKSPRHRQYSFSNKPDLQTHARIAREAATDGMVLLKNSSGTLPFKKNIKSVAAFGNTSYEIVTGGTGSGDVNEAYSVALIEGLQNGGYEVHSLLMKAYPVYLEDAKAKQPIDDSPLARFMPKPPIEEMKVQNDLLNQVATQADIALITIGRNSGEFADRKEDGDFYLTDREIDLIRTVSNEFRQKNKKTVVVLNIGGVIETARWKDYPDAILLAWQPGQEAGNSIVDVLSGKVNPSGKLTASFPLSYSDVPSAKNFPGKVLESSSASATAGDSGRGGLGLSGNRAEVVYEEDIYVGYRYYNSFNKEVSYAFGYGLSYTQFEYKGLTLKGDEFKDTMPLSVQVMNIGAVPGKEVVQVYLSAPAHKLDKPREELVAFAKTELLEPGKSQTLHFEITPRDLASFDTSLSSWIAEAGQYTVKIGASSQDFRQTAGFRLKDRIMVKKVNKALAPQRNINRINPLKRDGR
jgi:beta-glucosidase